MAEPMYFPWESWPVSEHEADENFTRWRDQLAEQGIDGELVLTEDGEWHLTMTETRTYRVLLTPGEGQGFKACKALEEKRRREGGA